MCADAEMLWLLRQNYARIRSPRDRTSAEEDGRTQTMGVSVVVIIDEAETVKKNAGGVCSGIRRCQR